MTSYIVLYACTALVFFVVDMVWLAFIARGFYAGQIGSLLLERPNMVVAGLFYAVFVVGLVWIAVAPAAAGGGWQTALINGALFGFFTYLTYDATNLATLKGFTPLVAVVDTAWGTVLSGLSAVIGYLLADALGHNLRG